MFNIQWFDNRPATGKFIMEMIFTDNNKAFIKNKSFDVLCNYMKILNKDCVKITIYDPSGNVVRVESNRKYLAAV